MAKKGVKKSKENKTNNLWKRILIIALIIVLLYSLAYYFGVTGKAVFFQRGVDSSFSSTESSDVPSQGDSGTPAITATNEPPVSTTGTNDPPISAEELRRSSWRT